MATGGSSASGVRSNVVRERTTRRNIGPGRERGLFPAWREVESASVFVFHELKSSFPPFGARELFDLSPRWQSDAVPVTCRKT